MMSKLQKYFSNIKSRLESCVFYNRTGKHSHYEEELNFFEEWIDSQLTVEEIEIIEFTSSYIRINVALSENDEDILINALMKLQKQKEILENE